MRRALKVWFAALGLVTAAAGCSEDLPKVTLIEHMRVLGAKQAVVGDETRAVPKPGETARLTWALAYPQIGATDDDIASFFIECTAPTRYTGTPVCQEFIDAAQGVSTGLGFGFQTPPMGCDQRPNSVQTVAGIRIVCVTGTPIVDVPIAKSVRSPRLVQGIICRNGVPQLDLDSPTGASCQAKPGGQLEEITVYGQVDVAVDAEEENQNPSMDLATIRIRPNEMAPAMPWTPTPPEQSRSGGKIVESSGHKGVLLLDYPRQTGSDSSEDIVISTYATFGELSRRFTVFESSGEMVDAPDLTWELSEEERTELEGKPKLVRFYFTVVDGRGGFDITTRELCVVRL